MKATIATLKSFVRKNADRLYVKQLSNFDGNVDCVMPVSDEYRKVEGIDLDNKHTLGIPGLWLVGSSRDYITPLENGFEVYNSCGKAQLIAK